jgi:predicted deacylase
LQSRYLKAELRLNDINSTMSKLCDAVLDLHTHNTKGRPHSLAWSSESSLQGAPVLKRLQYKRNTAQVQFLDIDWLWVVSSIC